jgi:nucleoside-diphosphate-sugar epimerase
MQPVHVEDLAEGIVAAIERDARGTFNLAGPRPLTYNELLCNCAEALQQNIRLVRIPHAAVASLVRILQNIPRFPLRYEQVMRLLEDKSFDIETARRALSYSPREFLSGVRSEVARLRQVGVIA